MFALITTNGITAIDQEPTLAAVQHYVGLTGEPAYIEGVYHQFSDSSIDLWCDDSFLLKGYQPTCRTPRGIVLHGNVVIAAHKGADTIGLTPEQFTLVKQQLFLCGAHQKRA